MMEPHDTGWVDQHIAALLCGVGPRYPWKPAAERLTTIGQDGGKTPQVAEPGFVHAVGSEEPPVGVNQQWPDQAGLVQIRAGLVPSFEGDDQRLDLKPIEFLSRLLQLQQVSAARQSEEMPVEHQQQPPAAVVFEPMLPPAGVAQGEGHGRTADEP
jgi:hypothetical protein